MTRTALDVCAGAGGLSLGLAAAGFHVLGVELDPDAFATHLGEVGPCVHADLTTYHPPRAFDVVGGGVPCQRFSAAGKGDGTAHPIGQLYQHLLRVARAASARCCFLENVRGMNWAPGANGCTALGEIEAAFRADGWHVASAMLDAANYGVPQNRQRRFIVGFRDPADLARFRWPAPTHARPPSLLGLRPWVTVREALGLGGDPYAAGAVEHARPNSHSGMRRLDVDSPAPTVAGTSAELLSRLDRPAPVVTARESLGCGEGEPARKSKRPWIAVRDALGALDRPSPTVTATEHKSAPRIGSNGGAAYPRRAGDRLASALDRPALTVSGGGTHGGGGAETFPNAAYRQRLSEALTRAGLDGRPATTVDTRGDLQAGRNGRAGESMRMATVDPLVESLRAARLIDRCATTVDTSGALSVAGNHARQKGGAVRLTLDQLAALQGWPQGFVFHGATVASRHRQIGNAVPPALGAAVGRAILAALDGAP